MLWIQGIWVGVDEYNIIDNIANTNIMIIIIIIIMLIIIMIIIYYYMNNITVL